MGKEAYINDTVQGLIKLTSFEKDILSSIEFNRLHDVYQNSTVYMTFPSNRTKRFEHSLGTMKVGSDMFFSAVTNSSTHTLNQFYSMYEAELENISQDLLDDEDLLSAYLAGKADFELSDVDTDEYIFLTPENVPAERAVTHAILIEAFRTAAMLHDIGHPPFSHVIEGSMRNAAEKLSTQSDIQYDDQKLNDFIDAMDPVMKEGKIVKQLHEEMGLEIAHNILNSLVHPVTEHETTKALENYKRLLVREVTMKMLRDDQPFNYLHDMIDGTMDCDRLDYVIRDSMNSGINAGRVDYSRIFGGMKILMQKGRPYFCIPNKAISSVEDYIKKRFIIYKDIIFHHRVIKTDAILQRVVESLIYQYLSKDPSSCSVKIYSDTKLHIGLLLPDNISGLWFPLKVKSGIPRATALSQWNDSWLITILKRIYFEEYYQHDFLVTDPEVEMDVSEKSKSHRKYVIQQQLCELLQNEKRYYSMIKRREHFTVIDDEIIKTLSDMDNKIKLLNNMIAIKQSGYPFDKRNKDGNLENSELNAVNILFDLAIDSEPLNLEKHKFEFRGNIAYHIAVVENKIFKKDFGKMIQQAVTEACESVFSNISIMDVLTVNKSVPVGLQKPVYFYTPSREIVTLNKVSGIESILSLESMYQPVFYIYLLLEHSTDEECILKKQEEFLRKVGSNIGQMFIDDLIVNGDTLQD